MARLIAALSGGVDSSVAAARALESGHEVLGVHLELSNHPSTLSARARGCGSPSDPLDAASVAAHLGIPFEVWDFSDRFHRVVVEGFLGEYARGRTPNPCLRCNEQIKFAQILRVALERGFDGMVTGHYARLDRLPDGAVELHRGSDPAKDQSYVLSVLSQSQLQRCLFPLGNSRKEDVREEARARGIEVADKPDSFDICFVSGDSTADYLREKLGVRPGVIEDESGTIVGQHQGTFAYTIGQRKGLRLGRPAADGQPRYVVKLDTQRDTVVVGPRSSLRVGRLLGVEPKWCNQPMEDALEAAVQVRAHGENLPARVEWDGDAVRIDLHQPAYGVAPGQTAAIYDATRVVGSVIIDETTIN